MNNAHGGEFANFIVMPRNHIPGENVYYCFEQQKPTTEAFFVVMSWLQEATLSRSIGNPHGRLLNFLRMTVFTQASKNEKVQTFPKHC
jgi:hypothetical protein